jgi:hypothetical protein
LVGEDLDVIFEGDVGRVEGKRAENVGVGAQRHVEHPVDGHDQQQKIDD